MDKIDHVISSPLRLSDSGREALRRVADIIEQHPENYNQAIYGSRCGSAHCIAGWLAVDAGAEPTPDLWWSTVVDPRSATPIFIGRFARQVLGYHDDDLDGLVVEDVLFAAGWEPIDGLTPADALRRLADGATLKDVTK